MPLFPSDRSAPSGQRRGRLLLLPIVLALAFGLFQYFGAETVTLPETGRVARVALSSDQEEQLGLQGFNEVLQTSRVLTSGAEVEQVARVTKRLIAGLDADSKRLGWAVSVVQNSEQNAFCLPGGKIVVFTGILPVTKTDDGLGAVLGHEIAHATLRHGSQRMLQQQLVQTALLGAQGSLAEMDYGQRQMIMGALGAGAQYGIILPYGRDHESEADEVGLRYMVRAGYDPEEAVRFWERMAEISRRPQPPEWASTHPAHGSRIDRIRELIPRVLQQERSEFK